MKVGAIEIIPQIKQANIPPITTAQLRCEKYITSEEIYTTHKIIDKTDAAEYT